MLLQTQSPSAFTLENVVVASMYFATAFTLSTLFAFSTTAGSGWFLLRTFSSCSKRHDNSEISSITHSQDLSHKDCIFYLLNKSICVKYFNITQSLLAGAVLWRGERCLGLMNFRASFNPPEATKIASACHRLLRPLALPRTAPFARNPMIVTFPLNILWRYLVCISRWQSASEYHNRDFISIATS